MAATREGLDSCPGVTGEELEKALEETLDLSSKYIRVVQVKNKKKDTLNRTRAHKARG